MLLEVTKRLFVVSDVRGESQFLECLVVKSVFECCRERLKLWLFC